MALTVLAACTSYASSEARLRERGGIVRIAVAVFLLLNGLAHLLGILTSGMFVAGYAAYRSDLRAARLAATEASGVILTSAGPIEWAEAGHGAPVLSLHGTGGGWDQGLYASRELVQRGFHVIAPSRFGYLGTPMHPAASPAYEADVWTEFLDSLGVQRAAVIAYSAGATPALQLALRHPDRVSHLILVVPARGGVFGGATNTVPAWVMNVVLRWDLPMWVARRFSRQTMLDLVAVPAELVPTLMPSDSAALERVISMIFPVSTRARGIAYDARNQNGAEGVYALDRITVPTLVISAEDDLYHTMLNAQRLAAQIPNAQLLAFRTGGHLLLGRSAEMWPVVQGFLEER